MSEHAELADWDRDHFWHAFTQMDEYEPLIVDHAEGVWLTDTQGNRFLDGISSMWCNLLGHRHPGIDAAIREQLDRVAHSTSLGMSNVPAIELAKRLAAITPGDLQHVFYASDGSSAVEIALKTVFQYWQQCKNPRPEKTEYIALDQAYHGDTLGSASVGGIERFNGIFGPLLFDVTHLPTPDPRRLPETIASDQAAEYFLSQLEQVLAERHEQIAAVVLEPLIQAAAGMVFHPPGYLKGVRELTHRYNVLLVTDEIVTGFGRTGRMFACDHEEITPDILCLGKSLSGGYLPMAAAITHPEIYSAFLGSSTSGRTLLHGHTFGGNPLAAAAALATLDALEEEQILATLPDKAAQLTRHLAKIEQLPHVAETRQKGLIAAIELTSTPDGNQSFPAELRVGAQICKETLSRGVMLRPLRDTLVIIPPLSISPEELDLLSNVLCESIDKITRQVANTLTPSP
ncbi:MAG: adenosylmethionine--8-amino-7-oxononanoate transaminase [Planctomycetes bacterium]|nr:adenosylmethionine--8-amino-7-oxononanoate transaminase [Planctomycetota bacterium]